MSPFQNGARQNSTALRTVPVTSWPRPFVPYWPPGPEMYMVTSITTNQSGHNRSLAQARFGTGVQAVSRYWARLPMYMVMIQQAAMHP